MTHRKTYTVWCEFSDLGFVTDDQQLAYEVRKGAETNCYTMDSDGCSHRSELAFLFCASVSGFYDCEIIEIWQDYTGEKIVDQKPK